MLELALTFMAFLPVEAGSSGSGWLELEMEGPSFSLETTSTTSQKWLMSPPSPELNRRERENKKENMRKTKSL